MTTQRKIAHSFFSQLFMVDPATAIWFPASAAEQKKKLMAGNFFDSSKGCITFFSLVVSNCLACLIFFRMFQRVSKKETIWIFQHKSLPRHRDLPRRGFHWWITRSEKLLPLVWQCIKSAWKKNTGTFPSNSFRKFWCCHVFFGQICFLR